MGGSSGKVYKIAESSVDEAASAASGGYEWIAKSSAKLTMKHEHYENTRGIGKGKFGLVFLSKHTQSHKYVAIKYIPKQMIYESQRLDRFQGEFDVLQSMNHPFVMQCFGGFETPTCLAVVCEFAFGGELYHRLKKRIKFSEEEAKFYFCELACTLRYLHEEKQIVYRDLKPENILIDHRGHVRICDFGFAVHNYQDEDDLKDGCGTAMYIAPEIANSKFTKGKHSFPVDWWALGCILFEMITGDAPFGDSDQRTKFELFKNITHNNPSYPFMMNGNLKKLLKGLLNKSANDRFNGAQVYASQWVAQVNWDSVAQLKITPPWIPPAGSEGSTENFLDWDLSLPSTPPSASVNSYVSTLHLPKLKVASSESDEIPGPPTNIRSPSLRGSPGKMDRRASMRREDSKIGGPTSMKAKAMSSKKILPTIDTD